MYTIKTTSIEITLTDAEDISAAIRAMSTGEVFRIKNGDWRGAYLNPKYIEYIRPDLTSADGKTGKVMIPDGMTLKARFDAAAEHLKIKPETEFDAVKIADEWVFVKKIKEAVAGDDIKTT
jgi:hypothetical protein